MIEIAGVTVNLDKFITQYPIGGIKKDILDAMTNSSDIYSFSSNDELKFQLDIRSNTVTASRNLNSSGMDFEVFRESYCNEDYWTRTEEGGFRLNEGVKPSKALNDIFNKGSKYGTECATAMVIVFYKAVLETYPEALFNKMFSNIMLMNWHYVDYDLDIRNYKDLKDYIPGDCLYFKNPDVDPSTPEWQGENTIYLGNDEYYGHGIGIKSAEKIISSLNRHRIEEDPQSAYQMNFATRPNYKYLAYRYNKYIQSDQSRNHRLELGYYRDTRVLPSYC